MGRTDEALSRYQKALALDDSNESLYQAIGRILYQRGALRESRPYLERAALLRSKEDKEDAAKDNRAQKTPAGAGSTVAEATGLAVAAFATTDSYAEMQGLVARYPFLTTPELISFFEKGVEQQVPPAHRPPWRQRIGWLRQVAAERKGT